MSFLINFLQNTLKESIFNLFLYVSFGVVVFLLVWKLLKNRWRWRRIQIKNEHRKHFFSHDLLFSLGSVLLAGVLTALINILDRLGFMKLYWDFNEQNLVWGSLQLFVLIFFYDAYFYWTHRLMHHPKIYRWVHKTHHKSTDPSPLTIFAFHPLENLIEFLPFLVLPMLVPIYSPILFLWQILDLINNLIAHLGYEIYLKKWLQLPIFKYKTVSTHHNMHHERFNGNYGLYFTFWDKLMGTEFGDYKNVFSEIHERLSK
jgi:sterol desaturase/sphingolipid hydroxylase (fatty acid hydroxylase superfamily)